VEDVSGKQLIRKFKIGPGFYDWAQTGEYLIIVRNSTGDDNTHVFCLDIKTGDSKDLTSFPGAKSEIAKISGQHPFEIVILSNKDDPLWFSAYKVNIITGEMELIFKNTEYINFSFDNDLKPRIGFKITKNGICGAYLLDDGKKPKFLKYVILEGSNKTKAFSHFAPDNNTVYGIESEEKLEYRKGDLTAYAIDHDKESNFYGGDKKVLTERNLKEGTVRVLCNDDKADIDHFMDKMVSVEHLRPKIIATDPATGEEIKYLEDYLYCQNLHIISTNKNDDTWLVSSSNSSSFPKYCLYRRKPQSVEFLFAERPALNSINYVRKVLLLSSLEMDWIWFAI
jgi:hypothetical protein